MPNRASHAGHIPQRTCVICRRKQNKNDLLRFVIWRKQPVFDLTGNLQARGFYVCDENSCLEKIDRWVIRKKRKDGKRNDPPEVGSK